jgi:hypothetical protein
MQNEFAEGKRGTREIRESKMTKRKREERIQNTF